MVTEVGTGCCLLSVPAPFGEVVDRLTILALKLDRAPSGAVRAHVSSFAAALESAWDAAGLPAWRSLPEVGELESVNTALWEIEDALRARELRQDFGDGFVRDARAVYRLNDRRAALKAEIDRRLASTFHEPKIHP